MARSQFRSFVFSLVLHVYDCACVWIVSEGVTERLTQSICAAALKCWRMGLLDLSFCGASVESWSRLPLHDLSTLLNL